MGNRAIYILIENGEWTYFYSHMGANALSPLLRLTQAKELQIKLSEFHSLAHIFEHLDYKGQYQNPRLMDADMFCERTEPISIPEYEQSYAQRGELEMKITLDLDENDCLLEYNPNCPWYRTMGSFSINLDAGVENVRRLLAHAEEHSIIDFGRLLTIYHRSTGLEEKLESARGYMRLEEYLDSPQVEEDRGRYREIVDRQAELDEEEMEEQ
jgi:hypothetical protein